MVQLILTCEHGGHRVPAEYRKLFVDATDVLQSHRGWDPGALELARTFEKQLDAPLISHSITRLLVELNRSMRHPRLFSEHTSKLNSETKQKILNQYYHPYRSLVEEVLKEKITSGMVVMHLSVHTFVPILNGEIRTADVGLLYDPVRPIEKHLCQSWLHSIKTQRPDLRVRRNYPYLGKADGFTTHLRRRFSPNCYAGIELEVNQRWLNEPVAWRQLSRDLAKSLKRIITTREFGGITPSFPPAM